MTANLEQQVLKLQAAQFRHDRNYHRDVLALDLTARLKHMALHFAKYVGKLGGIDRAEGWDVVLTDSLLIALSTANALEENLYKHLSYTGHSDDLKGLGALYGRMAFGTETGRLRHDAIVNYAAIASGRIANACEKIDHIETHPTRACIIAGAADFVMLGAVVLTSHDIDPAQAIRQKHLEIASNKPFAFTAE